MQRDGAFYIRQLNIFNERAERERLSAAVCRVYYVLLHIDNKLMWKNPFNTSIRAIETQSTIAHGTILDCLRRLRDGGYIKYRPSKVRGKGSEFEIVPLCSKIRTQKGAGCVPK